MAYSIALFPLLLWHDIDAYVLGFCLTGHGMLLCLLCLVDIQQRLFVSLS